MADTNIKADLEEDIQFQAAKKELETLKLKVEKADDVKSRLIVEKLEEDEIKEKAKQDLNDLIKKQDDCKKEFNQSMNILQDDISNLVKRKQDLLEKLRRCQAELEAKKVNSTELKQKFKISAPILDTEVKFVAEHEENNDDDSHLIRGVFDISQTPSVLLQGGQALITFEEKEVASQIMRIAMCSVSCEDMKVDVIPKSIIMGPVVKFEVHLDVFRNMLQVSNIPPSMPQERMKDRLEMSFSRPSRGGGEVERVTYDKKTGTANITFLHAGVAEPLALRGKYQLNLDREVDVQVKPIYEHQLRKFQTFCCSPNRTILLDGIKDIVDEEDLQDYLEIHFQKTCNSGGEMESIRYVSAGNALQAFFFEDNLERDD
ncbi:N-myc-interactor [Solea solea]|uniref:N-myc-interactor n=1 Tax=Solea solea TaxID=90069 RepID=UPI002729DF0F|nr:N-myc-interactor [Solea solea]XP_058510738.1 N-myc-interactor [Solea solea]